MLIPRVKIDTESSHSMIDEAFYGENLASRHTYDSMRGMKRLRTINVVEEPAYIKKPGYYMDTKFVDLDSKDVKNYNRWLETADKYVPLTARIHFCQFNEPTAFNGDTPSLTKGVIASKRCYGVIKCFMTLRKITKRVNIFRVALENHELVIGQDLLNLFEL